MKYLFLSTLLFTGYSALSQDLAYKIPQNATAVVSLKGDKLLELFSIPEFNRSAIGRKFLEEAKRKDGNGSYNSIEDFGIQLNGTAYYYNQQTDSIGYNCLLFRLADVSLFEQKFGESQRENIVVRDGFKIFTNNKENMILVWDNEKAYLVIGKLKDSYIEEDSVRAARYGIKKVNYSDYYYETPPASDEDFTVTDTAAVLENSYSVDVAAAPATDYAPTEDRPELIPITDSVVYENPPAEPWPPAPPTVAPPTANDAYATAEVSSYDNSFDQVAYQKAYEANKEAKEKLVKQWVYNYTLAGFKKNNADASIVSNAAYQRSLDKNAAATFYLADVPSLYQGFLPYYSYRYLGLGNSMKGFGSINARLYLGKEEARLVSEMEVDDKKAASYKKMYAHKPNKKFAKYLNSDKMVGFMSYAFDTETYLKELPEMLDQSMGRYFGLYNDEIGIGAELFSLLLDEKAVAKVIKGDALLVLSDVSPKEYTYTTYEYNDNYERTETKKTKTETLPDFLFMLSSDDTHLLERVLNYGIKKEKVILKNGIYTLDSKLTKSAPFTFHVLIKDGIIFCGTAYHDLQSISTDTYPANSTKEQKNLLLKNNMALYFNPKSLIGKLSKQELGDTRFLKGINTLLHNAGTFYARTTGVKGNYISGEMVATVPEDKANALAYFFSLVDLASKLD